MEKFDDTQTETQIIPITYSISSAAWLQAFGKQFLTQTNKNYDSAENNDDDFTSIQIVKMMVKEIIIIAIIITFTNDSWGDHNDRSCLYVCHL